MGYNKINKQNKNRNHAQHKIYIEKLNFEKKPQSCKENFHYLEKLVNDNLQF